MSGTVTREAVTINFSPSKQMYSFGKAQRFNEIKSKNDCFYYNLPNVRDKRSTSIGYGVKSDFSKPIPGRSSNIYDVPREFDLNRYNSPQFTFGLGREKCKTKNDLRKDNYPGPGNYNTKPRFGTDGKKFSIAGKMSVGEKDQSFPGPGAYGFMCINEQGKYPDSSLNNSPRFGFGFDKMKRFNESFNKNPGPGQYRTMCSIDGIGKIFTSRYGSNLGKSLGIKHKDLSCSMATPGPGSYNVFSEFEGFEKNEASRR